MEMTQKKILSYDKVVDKYLDWLKNMIDDKDMKPIQNITYEQCYQKLIGYLNEDK
jgi:hypothetical protein